VDRQGRFKRRVYSSRCSAPRARAYCSLGATLIGFPRFTYTVAGAFSPTVDKARKSATLGAVSTPHCTQSPKATPET